MLAALIDRLWFGPAAALTVIMGAAVAGSLAQPGVLEPFIVEGGLVETASVILHLLVAALALLLWRKGRPIAGVLFLASVLMAAREADLHRAFTTYGVFSTRFYVKANVPLDEKVLAVVVLAGLATIVGLLIWKARTDLRAIIRGRGAAFYSLASLAVFILALKEVDGLPRMLLKINVTLSQRENLVSRSIEEMGELFIPLLVFNLLAQAAGQLAVPGQPAVTPRVTSSLSVG